jgi:hypothetical protein
MPNPARRGEAQKADGRLEDGRWKMEDGRREEENVEPPTPKAFASRLLNVQMKRER